MKKLNQKQKTIVGVGAAALAIFALSSFGKKDKIEISGFDPDARRLHFLVNGVSYDRDVKFGAKLNRSVENRSLFVKMNPVDSQGNVVFGLFNGFDFIKELARVNVGSFDLSPKPVTPGTFGTNKLML